MHKYEIMPDKTVMIGVDLQKAFGEAVPVPGAAEAVENAVVALDQFRDRALGAVVLTRHAYTDPDQVGRLEDFLPGIFDALNADSPLAQLYDGVQRHGDTIIDKTRFSALQRTMLGEMIDERDFDTAVVFGLTTPICVESTVRELMMRDLKVILLEDACASQQLGGLSPAQAHESAVQTMGALFAETISTSEFISRTS
jgi:nicotinamidase-related amidase